MSTLATRWPYAIERLDVLTRAERARFTAHLCALDVRDRQLRFGAPLSDERIAHYVDALDFGRDRIFVTHAGGPVPKAAAHLALGQGWAELGVSVLAEHRGLGLGSQLFARALEYCVEWDVHELFTHCFANNRAMIQLSRRYGMRIVTEDGEATGFVAVNAAA
jgi:GNAT superfamily N-acetyltransferase